MKQKPAVERDKLCIHRMSTVACRKEYEYRMTIGGHSQKKEDLVHDRLPNQMD